MKFSLRAQSKRVPTLAEIFRDAQRRPPGPPQYDYTIQRSSEVLSPSGLCIRSLRDLPLPPGKGRMVLLAVAVYSLPELGLLDDIVKRHEEHEFDERLEILNILTCTQADFERRIPEIGKVFATPIAAMWEDGMLSKRAWGHAAVKLMEEHYALILVRR